MVDLPDARHRVKLIVGLGNPGAKYKGTRHNLGFEVVDEVARRHDLSFSTSPTDSVIARQTGATGRLILAKPLTFMNRSGYAVGGLSRYFDVETSDISSIQATLKTISPTFSVIMKSIFKAF